LPSANQTETHSYNVKTTLHSTGACCRTGGVCCLTHVTTCPNRSQYISVFSSTNQFNVNNQHIAQQIRNTMMFESLTDEITCVEIISGNVQMSNTQKDAFSLTKIRLLVRDVTHNPTAYLTVYYSSLRCLHTF